VKKGFIEVAFLLLLCGLVSGAANQSAVIPSPPVASPQISLQSLMNQLGVIQAGTEANSRDIQQTKTDIENLNSHYAIYTVAFFLFFQVLLMSARYFWRRYSQRKMFKRLRLRRIIAEKEIMRGQEEEIKRLKESLALQETVIQNFIKIKELTADKVVELTPPEVKPVKRGFWARLFKRGVKSG
jgi:hypothetical protein